MTAAVTFPGSSSFSTCSSTCGAGSRTSPAAVSGTFLLRAALRRMSLHALAVQRMTQAPGR